MTPRRRKDNSEYAEFVRRTIRGYARRVGQNGDTTDLPGLVGMADELEEAVAAAIQQLNERGFSWQAIGEATGLRRDHAWERWHRK